ncbi:MAG: hypothetical protein AB7Q81_10180 [Gammaproteobacteria bacterium]
MLATLLLVLGAWLPRPGHASIIDNAFVVDDDGGDNGDLRRAAARA